MIDEVNTEMNEPPVEHSILKEIASTDIWDVPRLSVWEDEESLRRWGFQYAIKERNVALLTPDSLLQQYQLKRKDEQDRWLSVYTGVQDRYNVKIENAKVEIKELEGKKLPEDPTKADLERRKIDLESGIKEDLKKIVEVRRTMVAGKQDILIKSMNEAVLQIDKINEIRKKAIEETRKQNGDEFNNSQKKREDRIKQLEVKRGGFFQRQEEVTWRMKLVNADGVNPSTANILLGVGTSVAAAAGYFFSVFTSTANFSSQDAFFFLLNGLLNAGSINDAGFFTKIGLLLLLVLLVGAISYVCYRIFKHITRDNDDKKPKDFVHFDAYNKVLKDTRGVSTEIKSGSWFSFWLQITPVVVIAGILILLLSLNSTAGGDVSKLNSSLEGVLTGTAVALGTGGLMCLYVMKIIEPRLLQRQKEEKGIVNWLKLNWELAVSMLALIAFSIAIIFYPINSSKLTNEEVKFIAVSGFMVVSLVSAFSFAYGIRFRGLIAVSRFLQREIDKLDEEIASMRIPRDPEQSPYFIAINNITSNMLSAIESRIALLNNTNRNVMPVVSKKDERNINLFWKLYNGFRKGIQSMVGVRNAPPISAAAKLVQLEDWEQQYFPDVSEEIKLLGTECIEKENELREVANQLDKLEADHSTQAAENIEKSKRLRKDIETLYTYIEKAEVTKGRLVAEINRFSVKSEAALLDGFHLGVWYRENQMGPTPLYYSNDKDVYTGEIDGTGEQGKNIKLLNYGNS